MTRARTFGLGALTAVVILAVAAFQRPAGPSAEAELADFTITVERSEDGIRLTCSEGCAWTELTWTAPPDRPQTVNEFGMTDSEEE
ncbi:MAG: hypothetical protein KatS3mg043_2165 [Rhodothermaceae bacterium]|nr:MAG: hypothetical protein KatS3mg043_2165 [Rhodothermaceae bacterium]